MSDTLDLELRLGLGLRDVAPRVTSNGATATTAADLLLRTGARKGADYGETSQHVEEAVGEVTDHGDTEPPPSAAEVTLPFPQVLQLVETDVGEEEEEEAAAPGSKRSKAESPATHQGDGGGSTTEAARVRAELVTRHGLPGDLPLHFVQEKVLTKSDLKSDQSRLLFRSEGSGRLRPFLSASELTRCGLLDARRREKPTPAQGQDAGARKKRQKTRYPGVPVLVYERGGAGRAAPAALRLNSFRSSMGIVIHGKGYRRFVAGSGFSPGDRVEVWAFRRPQDKHLCFVIAKREDDGDQPVMQEAKNESTAYDA